MVGPLRALSMVFCIASPTVASRVRPSALHSQTSPQSFAASTYSLFSGGSNAEDAPSRFIDAFKLGFKSASEGVKQKRVKDGDIQIKTWYTINDALEPLRKSIVPGDGQDLIDRVFASKIQEKFFADGPGGGKSGAKLYMLPFDPESGYSFILKGEDRDFVKNGVWPIIDEYARRLDPTNHDNSRRGSCEESAMMKVLMVFEPLNAHKSVNNRVWMLFTNINTLPMIKPNNNAVITYDLKHSREISRCSSVGTDDEGAVGYLGDFLREWEKPLRRTIRQEHLSNGSRMMQGPGGMGFLGSQYSKTTCLLKALGHDLAVLDSAYPTAKLVDQSALITMVQLRDAENRPRAETEEERRITDTHNNIIRIRRDDGTQWHMVVGLIDLFANKLAQKWKRFQSHTSTSEYVFDMKKFSMYPFQLGCLLQYVLYYKNYEVDMEGKLKAAIVNDNEGHIAESWPECYGKGDPLDTRYTHKDLGYSSIRNKVHDAGKNEYTCSLMSTCHEVLTTVAPANMQQCCSKGRYDEDLLGRGGESC